MGRRGANSRLTAELTPEEVLESVNSDLDDLYTNRRSARETALLSILNEFTWNVQYIFDFAKENFVNLLDRCLNSIKHGGESEIWLASCALGVLALTTGSGERASELVKENSFTVISRALACNYALETKAKLLHCLAMITFVGGGYDQEETSRAMKILWQFIHPKSGSNAVASPALTARAISAWSFLVTSMAGWTLIDSENWQELASHLSSLLEARDRSIRMAAGDALALLFEREDSETFEVEDSESSDAIETLKQKIVLQVEALSIEAGGRGVSKKNLNEQRAHFKRINEFIQKRYCPNKSVITGPKLAMASTWCGWKQWDFLYDFLGGHYIFWHFVEKNGLLEDLFEFITKKKVVDKKKNLTRAEKRMYKSPNSEVRKARAQELKKQRALFQRNLGHSSLID